MDPRDNSDLARFLVIPPRDPPPEACFRGGCDRAYYAAFGAARDALESASLFVSKGPSAHQEVINHLSNSGDGDVKAAAKSLDNLRTWRNEADYDVGLRAQPGGFPKFRAQAAVALAVTIIEKIDSAKTQDARLFIPKGV